MSSLHFTTRVRCPACESGSWRVIFQSPLDQSPIRDYLEAFYMPQGGGIEFEYLIGAVYCLCECDECRLVFQRDIPNSGLMERLYEHWIDPQRTLLQHLKHDDVTYHLYHAQEIAQFVAYFSDVPANLSFFDFGMGWGQWAKMACAMGCQAYGSEFSRTRINYAAAHGIKAVSWDEIPRHQFDLINTEQVFEHIPAPLQTLRHLKQALKPHGLIKISVPTASDIGRRLRLMDWKAPKGTRNSLNPVAPLEHINLFRRESIVRMAQQADLRETFIPLRLQYKYTVNWSLKRIVRNIVMPVYRNILKRQNNLLFCLNNPDSN